MTNILNTSDEFKEAWRNDLLEEVNEEIDDSWRHGNYYMTVFELFTLIPGTDIDDDKFKTTGEFYQANYAVTGDGEGHGIRDGDFTFYRVYPVDKVVTKTIRTWVKEKFVVK